MYECGFVNSVVPRDRLEAEVRKYAQACASNRPTDAVVIQKTFFEVFKQQQGEYLGSVLSGWLESMLPAVKSDGEMALGDATFDRGLAAAVKDNDNAYPPDWRLSYRGRKTAREPSEVERLREQVEALQRRLSALERKLAAGP
jgi:hypothetical protein